ncbi:response regulator transcription factor [Catenovulum sp. 2E275]|uniref:response regulator n=1 Tax=Catenovulum sp. 2E275 TaxID=2980497 RepID=UPI0021D3E581|nr:response regulator transcription factor [Catenovulum sp. 2E275]MCU4677667.1 response regulator transcription factor [Catenovulum sp. 2E275]
MTIKVLIVEDNAAMQSFLTTLLKNYGYELICFEQGLDALQYLTNHNVELILLDLGLDDIDGQDVLINLRSWSSIPVIVISARFSDKEKVQALDNGANDYVTKPFSAPELMARIRVALRQNQDNQVNQFEFGRVKVDPIARLVLCDGKEIHLTKIEYGILLLLLKNRDKVLTHNQILESVWGKNYIDRPEYVRVHIGQLRQKLEQNPAAPEYLKTEPGVGYRLITE